MKKLVSLPVVIVLVLSLGTVVFAEEAPENTTTVTAKVAHAVTYNIHIPMEADKITAPGVYEVGRASVSDVKNDTEKTRIYYTAPGTDFVKDDDDTKSLAATYYKEYISADNNWEIDLDNSESFTVYQSKAAVDPLTTFYVGIAEDDWNSADPGDYSATVTYSFVVDELCEVTLDLHEGVSLSLKGQPAPTTVLVQCGSQFVLYNAVTIGNYFFTFTDEYMGHKYSIDGGAKQDSIMSSIPAGTKSMTISIYSPF